MQVHDAEIEEMEESTCRLSICNLNWDRMNASDIFVLLDSFIQSKGKKIIKLIVRKKIIILIVRHFGILQEYKDW